MLVQQTQQIFRCLVDAFSRPGSIQSLKEWGIDEIAFTLLDREVTFATVGYSQSRIHQIIYKTMARESSIDEADYLFVSIDAAQEDVIQAIQKMKIGTLISPEKSSTLILEVDEKEGKNIQLRGCGIKDTHSIQLPTYWLKARNEKNKEYPLGIDCIFVTTEKGCIGLPRTTIVKEV